MTDTLGNLYIAPSTYGRIDVKEARAWMRIDCPFCGGTQARRVAGTIDGADPAVDWARCVNCLHGFVSNDDAISPAPLPLRTVGGIDESTRTAWTEVRKSMSVGATTAAVHMCRKILFHIAADQGLPAKNAKDRAPSFYECVEHLKKVGLVTPPMEQWVEQIREIGNQGPRTHPDLPG